MFSLVNGRKGCSINTSTGLITTTETALDTSTITARATFTSTDGKVVIRDDYDVEVKRRVYPTEVSINGAADPYDNQTYTLSIATSGVNGDYNVSWDLQGGLADYFSILSSDNSKCVLEIDGTAPDSKGGMLIATIKRRFDGVTVSSAALTLNHIVEWPENVAVVGENNPIDDLEYTWQQSNLTVTGDYYATWVLDGNITSYLSIASSDTMDCVLKIDRMPMEQIGGRLILTVYKSYNDEVIASTFRDLSAHKEGVIITDWSNAPIQEVLYNAGLVANATYTLKSEAETITAAQLQPGTAQTTSVFYAQRTNIKSFDEFKYFTGVTKVLQRTFQGCNAMTSIMLPNSVTELENYVFQGCSVLTDIAFSTSLLKLGSSTFAACSSLATVILPTGFTAIGSNAFIDCPNLESLFIPASTNGIGGNVFVNCGKLNIIVDANNQTFKSVDGVLFNKAGTKLLEYAKDVIQPEYVVPDGVTYVGNYAFYNRKNMTSIEFPSTLTRLGNDVISMCSNLKTLRFNGRTAPRLDNASVFGATDAAYTGRNTYSTGENKLYLSQLSATGFEEGLFLDPLQNASKCGFSIHGKLVINSNRSNATFSVSYTTESGSTKSISVGVGTSYISDIKYNTSVTVTPHTLSGYTWDSNSVSFTYSATSNSATLNAYVYPTNATISGATNPVDNPTYTWTTTTANVDGEYTATWALSGNITSYASIASQNNTSCTLSITEAPTEEISGTLTLTIKPKVGNTVTATKTLKALLPGVVITSKSNAPIQSALYAAGLVEHETYSLQSELEAITEAQLQPGTSYSTSIFYNSRASITSFDEFQYFTGLTTVPTYLFYGVYATSITLPSTITQIASYAFSNTSKLNDITLPEGLLSIDSYAFYNCNVTAHDIPASVTSIALTAFNTTGYKDIEINVSDDNTVYSSFDGVLYNKSKNTLYRCMRYIANFDTPSTVKIVGNGAFGSSRITNITFNEGLTTIQESAFTSAYVKVISLPSTLTTIGESAFSSTFGLTQITIPKKVSSIGEKAFEGSRVKSVIFENGCSVLAKQMFTRCEYLENVTLSNTMTTIPYCCFSQCSKLSTLTIPASITTIDTGGLAVWNLGEINCLATTAPTCAAANVFGNGTGQSNSFAYTGGGVTQANRKLRIPLNATGYESPYWTTLTGDRGFTIHGKITIASNKSNATFNITYISEGDVNKTVTVGVGTFYINDVKYGTSMTVTPNALSGYTWEKASTTITYNGAITVTLNAYIYPSSVTISGDSAIRGGNSATYTASVSPSNVDVGVTYSWSLSSSANASISSSNGNQCTITTQSVDTEENLTLTCVATTTDGKKVQNDFAILLQTGPSLITATYNITDTTSGTKLIYNSATSISYMEVDGIEVTPSKTYLFSDTGIHTVVLELSVLSRAFYNLKNLITLDLSQCNPSKYNEIDSMCYGCTALTSVNFGSKKWNNLIYASRSSSTFKECTSLESAQFPNGITAVGSGFFNGCTKLTSVVIPDSVKTMDYGVFDNCTNLTNLTFPSSISSLGSYIFRKCVNLKTIKFMRNRAPTISTTQTFGSSTSDYTGRNTYNTGENKIYVPVGATGYETGLWLDPLCDASKCGFTLSKTL